MNLCILPKKVVSRLTNPGRINGFLMLRLPAAYVCGVRVAAVTESSTVVRARTQWINRNPFGSMYFAVQAMAAELCTGILVMNAIRQSGGHVSMLITNLSAEYLKKAVGTITFTCESDKLDHYLVLVGQGEAVAFILTADGIDESGDLVSVHHFSWSLKAKRPLNS